MSLKEIDLKLNYDTSEDNLIDDFYNPVLEKTIKYDRIAGYFSSTSLAVAAKGITSFIKNKGKMRILCSPILSNEDYEVLMKVYDDNITNYLIESLENFSDDLINDYLKCFGWMLKNEFLEIKLVVPLDNKYLFHQKIGVMEDKQGNIISFSGSINETASGWLNNIEEFKVFKSWDESSKYCLSDVNKFNNFWNGLNDNIKVYDLPEAISNYLIKRAPTDINDLLAVIDTKLHNKTNQYTIPLHWYQKDAVEKWINCDYKMLLNMATGTGKTRTAIACIKHILNMNKHNLIIITAPQVPILHQWIGEIKELIKHPIHELLIQYGWRDKLHKMILKLSIKAINNLIIYVSHDTVYKEDFINEIKQTSFYINTMFIVDEVHGLGSKERRRGFIDFYKYRLGLSATPSRYFDDYGTKLIFKYFNDNEYEFTLRDALTTINPLTGKTFLVPYDYIPVFIKLTDDELIKYELISKKISKMAFYEDEETEEKIKTLLIKRAEIHKNAKNKMIELNNLIKRLKPIKDTIFFVSPQQKVEVLKILKDHDVIAAQFTEDEKTIKNQYNQYISEREQIITQFENGNYNSLVAIKCLDEGIDIPSARVGVLLSNSGNPREYIQRIGRVIRSNQNKQSATIIDFIVEPSFDKSVDIDLYETERKIIEKEFTRIFDIVRNARNNAEVLVILNERLKVF